MTTSPRSPPAHAMQLLQALLGSWSLTARFQEDGFTSMGAYCDDVWMRMEIGRLIQELERGLIPIPLALMNELADADARFRRNTVAMDRCIIDLWQDELVRNGKEPWAAWTCGQTNPTDHWYLYRRPE